jgi:mannose-6-phosphate isomerase-like protein (cupin superfamily)
MNTLEHDIRPWGEYFVIESNDKYKIKKIIVKAGKRLSLQSHHNREEHWVIVSGTGVFTFSDENQYLVEKLVQTGEHVKIFKNQKHRIQAITELTFVEVQLGICDENDITRYEDDFGRK